MYEKCETKAKLNHHIKYSTQQKLIIFAITDSGHLEDAVSALSHYSLATRLSVVLPFEYVSLLVVSVKLEGDEF